MNRRCGKEGVDRSKGSCGPSNGGRENKRELLRSEINQGLCVCVCVYMCVVMLPVFLRRAEAWVMMSERRDRTPRFEMNAIRETRVEHAFSPSSSALIFRCLDIQTLLSPISLVSSLRPLFRFSSLHPALFLDRISASPDYRL